MLERYIICERYADNGELSHRALVDSDTGEEVGSDGGEPEDATFWRDWKWVPELLNKQQATIADLQGQVSKWQEIASLRFAGDHTFVKEMELLKVENSALQQRVAQLEGEKGTLRLSLSALRDSYDELEGRHSDIQADHARVLGLVHALPNWKDLTLVPDNNQGRVLWTDESGCTSTIAVFSRLAHANKFIDLVNYRASLPAQPAQGGV